MKISEIEFARICRGIGEDRGSIVKHNPLGSDEEVLLWMLLNCLANYLSLSELETQCFTGKPDVKTYIDSIHFVLKDRKETDFDADFYLSELIA